MKRLNTAEWLLCAIVLLLAIITACLCELRADIKMFEEKAKVGEQKTEIYMIRPTVQKRIVTDKKITEEEPDEYVLRVLTAEAGNDELLCGCVAQALLNACIKTGLSPAETMREYKYTDPANFISDAARKAYDEVICSGVTYEAIGNATLFYAPRYCQSEWHESQRFVAEINGVRFFEEATP